LAIPSILAILDAVLLGHFSPLIVEIGMAMVRPEEFIIIKITLNLQG